MNFKALNVKYTEASVEDVNFAFKAARHAFDHGPWPKMSGRERGRIVQSLK